VLLIVQTLPVPYVQALAAALLPALSSALAGHGSVCVLGGVGYGAVVAHKLAVQVRSDSAIAREWRAQILHCGKVETVSLKRSCQGGRRWPACGAVSCLHNWHVHTAGPVHVSLRFCVYSAARSG